MKKDFNVTVLNNPSFSQSQSSPGPSSDISTSGEFYTLSIVKLEAGRYNSTLIVISLGMNLFRKTIIDGKKFTLD